MYQSTLTNEQIARNVKIIRNFYGDTRRELAEKSSYPYDTIVAYESEKRDVTDDYIKEIERQYRIPAIIIKNQEIERRMLEGLRDVLDVCKVSDISADILGLLFAFPAVSDAALSNDKFKSAHELYKKIESSVDDLEKATTILPSMPKQARVLYYLSFSQDGIVAGAANTIMMMFFELLSLNGMQRETIEKFVQGSATKGDIYIEIRNMTDRWKAIRKKFIMENSAIFDECISALGSSGVTGMKLAEYYTALKYFYCMLDNGRDLRENMEIGRVMMKEFSHFDNKMATRFIEMLSSIMNVI